MICDHRIRTVISIVSFLTVFMGVNSIVWWIAGEPTIYVGIAVAGYIILSVFTGMYTSLALGHLRIRETGSLKIILESIISMGFLPVRRYRSWGEGGAPIIVVSTLLSMGFLSSYWHYRLYGESCLEEKMFESGGSSENEIQ